MAWELREIRLSGFKSFSRRTRVAMSSGMTAIVGSNGCGKTNIADAVRYALGEMRPHQLRVENLEDIIFAGTAEAPPLAVAEVHVVFDETVSGDSLTLTRRLVRGGDAEYRIDGQQARLKDVIRKLEQIGIASHRGVVVELRQMDELLVDGSKLPRLMVEEGCGIAPFLEKRNQAQSKLDASLRLLEQLEPRIQQIELELERLAQQAQRAKRWKNARTALDAARNNERWGIVRRLRAEITAVSESLAKLRENNVAELELTQIETDSIEAEREAIAVQTEWDALTEQLFSIASEREQVSARLQETELIRVKQETLLGSMMSEITRIESELAELAIEPQSDIPERFQAANAEWDELQSSVTAAEAALTDLQTRRDEYARTLAIFEMKHSSSETRLREGREAAERMRRQMQELQPLPVPDAAIGREWERVIAEANLEENKYRNLLSQQQEVVRHHDTQLQTMRQDLANLRADANRLVRELQWVDRMLTDRPDLTKTLRDFLATHSQELRLLRDEGAEYSPLLHRIAGVDRIAVPVAILPQMVRDALQKNIDAEWTIDSVVEVVELERLLQESPPVGIEWLSTEGVSRNASGVLRTSAREAKANLPVGLPRQRKLLDSQLTGIKESEQRVAEELSAAEYQAKIAIGNLQLTRDQISKLNISRAELERNLLQFKASVSETESRNALRQSEYDRLQTALDALLRDLESAETEHAQLLPPNLPDVTPALQEATERMQQLTQERERVREIVRSLKLESETFQAKLEQRRARIVFLTNRTDELSQRSDELTTSLKSIDENLLALRKDIAGKVSYEKSLQAQRGSFAERRTMAQNRLSELRIRENEMRTQVEGWRTDLALLAEKSQRLSEHLLEQEHLAAETGPEPKETVRVGAEEVQRLEQRLRSLEPVNHLAEEEFDRLKGEVDYLRSERQQIIAAADVHRNSVEEAVHFAIERLTVSRVKIEHTFAEVIARLFPGGEASLEWGEGDILTDAPLQLRVSPRGKRIRSLRILSGGERALVALAFLVAVLSHTRPLPFIVLDEVDAPLDEENTNRFLHWIQELTSTTQVILLTHNRQSIASAHSWVGVTMPEPGISQVVKVIPSQ
ncbi:MAG: chromosome segregation protein SMC [bacterium]|nr:chromosome segregation protein SMC [bacterium]